MTLVERLRQFDKFGNGRPGDTRFSEVAVQAADTIDELVDALHEISLGLGEFNREPLIHAENTIESMKKIASEALGKTTKTSETDALTSDNSETGQSARDKQHSSDMVERVARAGQGEGPGAWIETSGGLTVSQYMLARLIEFAGVVQKGRYEENYRGDPWEGQTSETRHEPNNFAGQAIPILQGFHDLLPTLVEASHHAELVEELAEVTEVAKGCAKREHQCFLDRKELLLALKRSRLALNMVPANDKRFDPANHAQIKVATDIIDAAIAKIGGEVSVL